jgi:hypothetical protein
MSNRYGKQLTKRPVKVNGTSYNQSPGNCASCNNSCSYA